MKIILELIFRSRCRHSCSLQFWGGRIADRNCFGITFYVITDTDTEKYYFRIISAMNSDKRYPWALRGGASQDSPPKFRGGLQKHLKTRGFGPSAPSMPGDWEKESIHRPAPVQNFSLQKKMGSTEERFRWWIWVFLVFIGFLYPPPAWKVFLLGQKSSPKDFLSFFFFWRGLPVVPVLLVVPQGLLSLDPWVFPAVFWGGFGDLCWAIVLDLSCLLFRLLGGQALILLSSCSGPPCVYYVFFFFAILLFLVAPVCRLLA